MRTLILALLTTAAGCYSQATPVTPPSSPAKPAAIDAPIASARDLAGATYCELGQPGMICLAVAPPTNGGLLEYTITRDDCLETGYVTGSGNPYITFVQYPDRITKSSPACIGGAKAYRATAVFVDDGIDILVESTQAVIELEQVH